MIVTNGLGFDFHSRLTVPFRIFKLALTQIKRGYVSKPVGIIGMTVANSLQIYCKSLQIQFLSFFETVLSLQNHCQISKSCGVDWTFVANSRIKNFQSFSYVFGSVPISTPRVKHQAKVAEMRSKLQMIHIFILFRNIDCFSVGRLCLAKLSQLTQYRSLPIQRTAKMLICADCAGMLYEFFRKAQRFRVITGHKRELCRSQKRLNRGKQFGRAHIVFGRLDPANLALS